jgi:transposase
MVWSSALGNPKKLWACHEAGPTGYGLYRQLSAMGVRCEVIAPSPVPKGRGDRIKPKRTAAEARNGP